MQMKLFSCQLKRCMASCEGPVLTLVVLGNYLVLERSIDNCRFCL